MCSNTNAAPIQTHALNKTICFMDDRYSRLKSVEKVLALNKQAERDGDLATNFEDLVNEAEVSEYPIEYYENQQHEIERQMSVR